MLYADFFLFFATLVLKALFELGLGSVSGQVKCPMAWRPALPNLKTQGIWVP